MGKNTHDAAVLSKVDDVDNFTDDLFRSSKSIENLDEAHQWGNKYYDNWLNSLTDDEVLAIKQYTGNDYEVINSYLRGIRDDLDGIDPKIIDNIKSGLKKTKVPHDMQVFRGTDLKPFEKLIEIRKKDGKINCDSLIGKTFKDNGFISSAIIKESSFDYMKVSWKINVPKGTDAAYVGKISYVPEEAELLFNAGQEMIIKEAIIDSSGKMQVVLDVVQKK